MTVKELIEALSKQDETLEVRYSPASYVPMEVWVSPPFKSVFVYDNPADGSVPKIVIIQAE